MSSKILLILLIVGLVSVKVTNAQAVEGVVKALGELIGAIIAGIVTLVTQIVSTVLGAVTQLISNNPNDTSVSGVLSALAQLISNNSNDAGVFGVLSALSQLISTAINNPNDGSAIDALLAALQQAIQKISNCGVLKNGKQYYLQSANGSFSEGYVRVQASVSLTESERRAILTSQLSKASKFTAVQKNCNTYGLCVRGLCMSRCEGCNTGTGTDQHQTVTFHVTNSTLSVSQWTLSSIGDVTGPYNLKSDVELYLDYVRLRTGTAVVSLNATLFPESQFKFIEVEPCTGILEDGQQYYLKSSNTDYVVVKGGLPYSEQIGEASATKFRAVQWECNVYGFCIDGTDGVQCMSRCANCESDTEIRFNVTDSLRPYSQWTLSDSTNSGLYLLSAEEDYGNVYFSDEKQLELDLNYSFEFQFIKVT